MKSPINLPTWLILKAGGVWDIYKLDGHFYQSYNWVAEFPSGAEAIAAFAAGGR